MTELEHFVELLACPRCEGALSTTPDRALRCAREGATYAVADGVPDLRLSGDAETEVVRSFYEAAPFPGYPDAADAMWLRARAARSEFARLLDRSIADDARIVELGCGTGQMSLFLARADRRIVGADLAPASLEVARAAAQRFGLERRVLFLETDLARPGLRRGAFDVVYASGVLHHTPDPRRSFAEVARLVRPGGVVVIGLYHALGRLAHRLRRAVAHATGERWIPLDPVLRDRQAEPARRTAWLRDRYRHPLEHRHLLGEVRRWFDENGIEYLRAYPSTLLGGGTLGEGDLFTPEPDDWGFENALAQLSWAATLAHEGGLFVTIGRRIT